MSIRIVYPVSDLTAATTVFTTALGVEPHTVTAYYVGFNVDGVEIGLNPNGHASGMTGPVPFVDVDDVDARRTALLEAGASAGQDPADVGGGTRTATVLDADGNPIGLLSARSS